MSKRLQLRPLKRHYVEDAPLRGSNNKPKAEDSPPDKSKSNSEQTENKLSTQPRTEPRTELRTNSEQIQNKLRTRIRDSEQTENKLSTQPRTELRTNSEQIQNKLRTISSFSQLVGLQRKIIEVIYAFCRSLGEKTTGKLSLEFLAASCKAGPAVVQVTTRRLIAKGVLVKFESKEGRGGWTRYSLPEAVYKELFNLETENKLRTNTEQTENKLSTQPRTEPRTSHSSSSRDLNIKEPTTTQPAMELSTIDLGLVQHLGITTSVLARCIELYPNLQPEQLEGLVFRFAEFVKDPKNRVQNARGFFISLAEQSSKGQIPLDHIETPDERLMRLFVERQKEAKTRRVEIEQAALEFECEAWLESLTLETKLTLVPETSLLRAGTAAHQAMLKSHFVESVWPERRRQILEHGANP